VVNGAKNLFRSRFGIFSDIALQIELESPLLGGDLGVGKSVIREILNEISRPRNPPLNPSREGNNLCHYKICGFKLNTDKVVETSRWVISAFVLAIT